VAGYTLRKAVRENIGWRFIDVQTVRAHDDESARYLTRVLAAAAITGAHHLVVDDDVDAVGPMPPFAHAIIDHGHVHRLQRLGPQSGAWTERFAYSQADLIYLVGRAAVFISSTR